MARTRNSQGQQKKPAWGMPAGTSREESGDEGLSLVGEFVPNLWYDESLAGTRHAGLMDIVSGIGPGRIMKGSLAEDEILRLLGAYEQCALAMREMYARMHDGSEDTVRRPLSGRKLGRRFMADICVEVTFEGGLLRIRAPHTFARSLNESWYLADLLKVRILECVNEKGPVSIKPPVHLVVKRIDHRTRQSYRDNDNTENSRLINEVFRALGYNDSPNNMAYTSLLKIVEEGEWTGTEIVVFSEEDLAKHMDEFRQR